ncbi:MAG: hypothetical protein ABIE55_04055 [Candidatus Aenigmatarchaeota archaeon]
MGTPNFEIKREEHKKWLEEQGIPFGRCDYAPKEGNLGTNKCSIYSHVDPEFQVFTCLSACGNEVNGFENNLKVTPCEHKRLKDQYEKK